MKSLFAKRSVKICAVAVGIIAVLAVAFFVGPGMRTTPSTRHLSAPPITDASELLSVPDLPLIDTDLGLALESALAAGLEQGSQPPQSESAAGEPIQPSGAVPASSSGNNTAAQHSAPAVATAPSTRTAPASVAVTTAKSAAATTSQAKATTTKYTYTAATKAPTSSAAATTSTRPSSASTASTTTTSTTTQKVNTVTLSIRCDTILNNMDKLRANKASFVPANGVIMAARTVTFNEGDTVFTVLQRETRASNIHMEFSNNPMFNSVYIEGINNLYEFDCGELSGWMYKVNGWFPNYGCSNYTLKQGDVIEWVYTCDLGKDVGGDKATQG